MRMSGFIVGGILGAAAAIYFTKNNKPMMMSYVNWDQAVDKAGNIVRGAKTMWDTASEIKTSSSDHSSSNKNTGKDLDKLEKIISKDESLSKHVNEIMKESGSPTIQ